MNRRLLGIAVGASLVLAAAWYLLMWSPQGAKVDAAHAQTIAATSTNDQLQLRLARLQAAQKQEQSLRADFDLLAEAMPDDPALAKFILDANDAATEAGVDFLSISPGEPQQTAAGVPTAIPLEVTVKGGYYQALDYLDTLSKMSRIVVIYSLAMSPDAAGQDLSISMSARMFTDQAPVDPNAAATTATTVAPGGEANQPVTTVTTPAPQITVTANRP